MNALRQHLSSIRLEDLAPSTRSTIVVDAENGCWIWQGKRWSGYGPHRRLYERYVGKIPEGYDLHHTCHNGRGGCCNPNHSEPVPSQVHRRQHRQRDGKLGREAAAEVRKLLVEGTVSMEELAARYGVTRTVVQKIGLGELWLEPDAPLGEHIVYTRTCAFCWTTFQTTSRRKRYCCVDHQVRFNNIDPRERHKPPQERIKRTYAGKIVGVGIE